MYFREVIIDRWQKNKKSYKQNVVKLCKICNNNEIKVKELLQNGKNITKLLNVYYNFVKILDNIKKKDKIVV